MILNVTMSMPGMMGMTLQGEFQAVVDTEDEARDFGSNAANLWAAWNDGFIAQHEEDEEGDD